MRSSPLTVERALPLAFPLPADRMAQCQPKRAMHERSIVEPAMIFKPLQPIPMRSLALAQAQQQGTRIAIQSARCESCALDPAYLIGEI